MIRPIRLLLCCMAMLALGVALAPAAEAARPERGIYKGKIVPTDSESPREDAKRVRFQVTKGGRKIVRMRMPFYYGCYRSGFYQLIYYVFPSTDRNERIRVRRNGRFTARDVIDRELGFYVTLKGRFTGRKRARGTIVLDTDVDAGGCERKLEWHAKRR